VRLELELRLLAGATIDDAIATQSWIEKHVRAEHAVVGNILVRLQPSVPRTSRDAGATWAASMAPTTVPLVVANSRNMPTRISVISSRS
jgi:hypothetical protein